MTKYQITAEQVGYLKQLSSLSKVVARQRARTWETQRLLKEMIYHGKARGLSVNKIAGAVGLSTARVGQIWKEMEDDQSEPS